MATAPGGWRPPGRPPRAAALLLLLLALPPLAGCATAPTPSLAVERIFDRSDATYHAANATYEVRVQGVVANRGEVAARGVALHLGVGDGCLHRPAMPGHVDVGSLAPGSRANFAGAFTQPAARLPREALWYEAVAGDDRRVVARGCDALSAGPSQGAP